MSSHNRSKTLKPSTLKILGVKQKDNTQNQTSNNTQTISREVLQDNISQAVTSAVASILTLDDAVAAIEEAEQTENVEEQATQEATDTVEVEAPEATDTVEVEAPEATETVEEKESDEKPTGTTHDPHAVTTQDEDKNNTPQTYSVNDNQIVIEVYGCCIPSKTHKYIANNRSDNQKKKIVIKIKINEN